MFYVQTFLEMALCLAPMLNCIVIYVVWYPQIKFQSSGGAGSLDDTLHYAVQEWQGYCRSSTLRWEVLS